MVSFEGNYWHPLDRNYSQHKYISKDFGISTPPFNDQLQALRARIFQGAQHAELGFLNGPLQAGSSARGSPSPEMYGKDERQAMQELAKVNKISLSTHASANAGALSGMGEKRFSDDNRYKTIGEIKRGIEFAADVAQGGPIVVHAHEYPRPVHEIKGVDKGKFEEYPGAERETVHHLVDGRTGDIITQVREDQKNFVPVEKGTQKSVWGEDMRELQTDINSGRIEIKSKDWSAYMKENDNDPDKASVAFYKDSLAESKAQSVGQASGFEDRSYLARERAGKIRTALQKYEHHRELWDNDYLRKKFIYEEKIAEFVPSEEQNPIEYLRKALWQLEKDIAYGQETAASARAQVAKIEDIEKNIKPIGEFAIDKAADSLARLGMFAMTEAKKKDISKPFFIAPENLSPEMYGGHPEELRDLIIKSRERMAELLVRDGMSESAAKREAGERIKATFDVGHANIWRHFFKGKKEDFEKWLVKQAAELQRAGVLGHVHLSDNFGYVDEHVTPGQGNIPVEEFLAHLKREGFKGKFVVEPGHQDVQAWLGALKASQSPVYRIDGASHTWTDIESGYFGRTRSPRYIFGPYSPDEKTWTLYSEVPLE